MTEPTSSRCEIDGASDCMMCTPGLRSVLRLAAGRARELGHARVDAAHYILAILARGGGMGSQLLLEMGADPKALEQAVREALPQGRDGASPNLQSGVHAQAVLDAAKRIAREGGCRLLSTEHVFLAAVREAEPPIRQALARCGVTDEKARKALDAVYDLMAELMTGTPMQGQKEPDDEDGNG